MNFNIFIVPILGYIGLWLLAMPLFILYFKIYKIRVDLKQTVGMIQKLPAWLTIITVPVCSFLSFFLVTKAVFYLRPAPMNAIPAWEIGVVSLIVTIILDILITVIGEKMNILKYPVNLMYLLAYLAIVPAVLLAA